MTSGFLSTQEVNALLVKQQRQVASGKMKCFSVILVPPLVDRSLKLDEKAVTFWGVPESDCIRYLEAGFCPAIDYPNNWAIAGEHAHIVCEINWLLTPKGQDFKFKYCPPFNL